MRPAGVARKCQRLQTRALYATAKQSSGTEERMKLQRFGYFPDASRSTRCPMCGEGENVTIKDEQVIQCSECGYDAALDVYCRDCRNYHEAGECPLREDE